MESQCPDSLNFIMLYLKHVLFSLSEVCSKAHKNRAKNPYICYIII